MLIRIRPDARPTTPAAKDPMRNDTIESFLAALADRVPAPGGGATAALHAAQASALVAMVARYSDAPRFAEHAETIAAVTAEADQLRDRAVTLAAADADAFTVVTQAYRLPKDTDSQKAARSGAIATALVGAARVPALVISVADRILDLAELLAPIGNRTVISDVAAAAEAARAAATTARVNVEVNLSGITDSDARRELAAGIESVDDLSLRAEKLTASVREGFAR